MEGSTVWGAGSGFEIEEGLNLKMLPMTTMPLRPSSSIQVSSRLHHHTPCRPGHCGSSLTSAWLKLLMTCDCECWFSSGMVQVHCSGLLEIRTRERDRERERERG